MLKEETATERIDEKEFAKALSMFRNIPAEKQMFAIAFINGMEFQKSIGENGRSELSVLSQH